MPKSAQQLDRFGFQSSSVVSAAAHDYRAVSSLNIFSVKVLIRASINTWEMAIYGYS